MDVIGTDADIFMKIFDEDLFLSVYVCINVCDLVLPNKVELFYNVPINGFVGVVGIVRGNRILRMVPRVIKFHICSHY